MEFGHASSASSTSSRAAGVRRHRALRMRASSPEEIAPPRRPYRHRKTKAADGQATSGAAAGVVVAPQQAQAQAQPQPQAIFASMLHQAPPLQAQPAQQQQQPMMCYVQCRPPDVVVAYGNGPRGRSVAGFVTAPLGIPDQSYSAGNSIICTCHGETFSPAGFLLHAGATDLSNPMRQISAFPWLALSPAPAPGPPGGNNDTASCG